MDTKYCNLPDLNFGYGSLKPYLSEEQIRIHYEKHHQAYIKTVNDLTDKLESARKNNTDIDMRAALKTLSFNIGGHVLHSLFWENLTAPKNNQSPQGEIAVRINEDFGSFERFKNEFTQAALSVEGSGWGALSFCETNGRLLIMQIEKHNVNIYPQFKILLVVDVFEHAYYIDYQNDRAKYLENIWNIINWDAVNKRLGT